jgi:hypothetical protein
MRGKLPIQLQTLFEDLKKQKIKMDDPFGSTFSNTYETTVGEGFESIINEIEEWIEINYESNPSMEPLIEYFKD